MRQPTNNEIIFDGFYQNGFIDVRNDTPQSIRDVVIDQPGGEGSSFWEGATSQSIEECPDVTEIATIKAYLTGCYDGRDWLNLLGSSQLYSGVYAGWLSVDEQKAYVADFGS